MSIARLGSLAGRTGSLFMASNDDTTALIESLRSAFLDPGSLPRNFVLESWSYVDCGDLTRAEFEAPPLDTSSDAILEVILSHNPQPIAQDHRDAHAEVKLGSAVAHAA